MKYVVFILRADNDGEGGVMALAALARTAVRPGGRRFGLVMLLGVLGASLFYGDSVITPAISVMSAIEGLSVTTPGSPTSSSRSGPPSSRSCSASSASGRTGSAGSSGPSWSCGSPCSPCSGVPRWSRDPAILRGLSPHYAVLFVVEHPIIAFVAMGAVVLSITGAEALYADMGHFGRGPIRRAWFLVVFPALTLNYLGQGALILRRPDKAVNPFFLPGPGLPRDSPRRAGDDRHGHRLAGGDLRRLLGVPPGRASGLPAPAHRAAHLQQERGQIYVAAVNWSLFVGVMLLLVVFGSSARLATAYGLAVTGTFLITTTLFLIFAQSAWGWGRGRLALLGVPLAVLELTYFGANLTKVLHGGWLPLLIALIVATVMLTWQRGRTLVTERRTEMEGPLEPFIDWLHGDPVARVPGTAVFLHPSKQSTPLALRENATFNHVIHENVLIVSTTSENVPHIPDDERVELDHLGDPYDAITHLTLRFGFQEEQDVPAALALAREQGIVEVDPDTAYYFLSRINIQRGPRRRDEPVAQAAVPRPGAQRRLADRVLPAPRGPDRRHGCHRRPLARAAAVRHAADALAHSLRADPGGY